MKRFLPSVAALLMTVAPADAQDDLLASCATITPVAAGVPQAALDAAAPQFRFLCGQVVNGITVVQPSTGIAFSGGAHTLGTATTIGRRLGLFPRVSLTARVNGAFAEVPDLLDGFDPRFDGTGDFDAMGTAVVPVASIQGDIAVGLFNGVALGPTAGGFGALDLLGSISYVPALEEIGSDEIINGGIGARIGILRQGLVMPGISLSGMYRTMFDDIAFGDIGAGDPAEFTTDLSTVSLRLGVSKGLLMFDLAAGAGYDRYTSDVRFDWELDCPPDQCGTSTSLRPAEPVSGELTTAAWNVYGNLGINLVVLNIVGEVGYQTALDIVDAEALRDAGYPSDVPPLTAEALDDGRFFASLGLRLTI